VDRVRVRDQVAEAVTRHLRDLDQGRGMLLGGEFCTRCQPSRRMLSRVAASRTQTISGMSNLSR
jgi:hypothetical protein